MSGQVALLVSPARALVDVPVDIRVAGLSPRQPVTLQARLVEVPDRVQSYAHYRADDSGRVAVGQQPSLGGLLRVSGINTVFCDLEYMPLVCNLSIWWTPQNVTNTCLQTPNPFSGVEQMGLFWSMQPSPGQSLGQRLDKENVTTPHLVDISVHEGHVDVMGEDTLPRLAHTCVEWWYMADGVKRMPVKEGRIRGTLFLPPGPGKFPGVLDMYGVLGGLTERRAALLASRGFAALALAYFNYDDLPKDVTDIDLDYFEEATDWLLRQPSVLGPGVGALGISKGGEIALAMAVHLDKSIARMKAHGKTNFTRLTYEGAGHVIEPPYTPHCSTGNLNGVFTAFGGNPKDVVAAQEDSWFKILGFLRRHLDKKRTDSRLCEDYRSLLTIDGKKVPDPLEDLKSGWQTEGEGMQHWPPTMYADMAEYLVASGEVDLRKRLMGDYKDGKAFSYFDAYMKFCITLLAMSQMCAL
ncbi:bile acid-CoA:amino acid N-acyltransferase-like [Branchiostoma lanceolatum]|uniref:bile acid-CoA:amino acid N-acyltransferase-like n=1 Tax=Branchiostoma lanceolatum TaxID=7740 RepID=UPI0034532457